MSAAADSLDPRESYATRGTTLARIVALSMLSVPFLHLYLPVELTPRELLVHTLDVGLGVGLAWTVTSLALAAAPRLSGPRLAWLGAWSPDARRGIGGGLALVLFLLVFQGLVPGAEAILERHVVSGHGDMALRIVPLGALIGYGSWAAEHRSTLRRQLAELRAANARIDDPAVSLPREAEPSLVLAHAGGVLTVSVAEVLRVQAMENYCELVLRPEHEAGSVRRVLVRMTLAEARAKLPAQSYVQTHRSHLVRVDGVREILREGRSLVVDMGPGGRVPVSRTQRDELLARVGRPAASDPPS